MASLAVSSNILTISFCDKIVVFRRSGPNQLLEESVFPIEVVKEEKGTPVTDGHIPMVCSSFSSSGKYFAACTNKMLTLWDATSWSLLASSSLARAASSIAFSNSEDKIVIADKSGDAYMFTVQDLHSKPEPSLLLGHVSMLLKIIISKDDKYVLTCDRDEKIRVSHFPNAYNIQTYCLGHEDSVTCLNFPETLPNILISGSSDGSVRFWNYCTGELLLTQDCSVAENTLVIDLVSFTVSPTSFVVCVILNKCNNLRILSINDSDSLECRSVEDLSLPCSSPRMLVSCSDELFILSYDSPNFITAFKFADKFFDCSTNLNEKLKEITRKFNDDFLRITDQLPDDRLLSYLNKRKIDDTQDYYRRKNERLLGNVK